MTRMVQSRMINRAAGFSLIELIVVLLIMTTMMAVAAPRVAGRSEAAILRSAATDFQTLASAARAKAVLQQRTITLQIDDGSIGLFAIPPASESKTGVDSLGNSRGQLQQVRESENTTPPEPVSRSRELPEGLVAVFEAAKGDDNGLAFYPDGSADSGTLLIANARDERIALTLSAATGRLRLAE